MESPFYDRRGFFIDSEVRYRLTPTQKTAAESQLTSTAP